jgi:phage repressor protein C with HTH and peptisase S24 domain
MQAFRVGGDSMEPLIAQDGIVMVDVSKNDITDLDEGEIYVLCWDISTEECAVKRLKWADWGSLLAIESADPNAYETIYRRPEDVVLVGKVIWTWREFSG